MVMSNLIDNEYPFLQKELFLHLGDVSPSHPDYDPAAAADPATSTCTRGEGCTNRVLRGVSSLLASEPRRLASKSPRKRKMLLSLHPSGRA